MPEFVLSTIEPFYLGAGMEAEADIVAGPVALLIAQDWFQQGNGFVDDLGADDFRESVEDTAAKSG